MTEKEFAEIVARALLMVFRAMNKRYGLHMWILTRQERREIQRCMNGDIDEKTLMKMFQDL